MIVDTFTFDPPLWMFVTEINVYDIGGGCYDLFDQNGQCWNEGVIFTFKPTKAEVEEWVNTGEIKGKLVTV